jgi:dTDP-L-rhamnose 4-epimerase
MRILLTGSSGFIGRRIAQAADAAGYEVRTFDRSPDLDPEFLADVTDAAALDTAMDGVDVVCHQAAKVGLGVHLSDMPDYVRDNDLGTAEVLAAMERAGVMSLVLASSMVVYGEGAYRCEQHAAQPAPPRTVADLDGGLFDPRCAQCGGALTPELVAEGAPLDPRNTYAATKVTQEHLGAVWAHTTEGSAIALRYHNVYGPGMPRNTPYAGVASIFRSHIADGRPPQVFEDGAQRRDFVHVDDVAAANLAAIDAVRTGTHRFRPYNVGSGQVRTVHDMASALSDALGGKRPQVTGQYRLGDVRHITASSQRIRDELSWRPQIDFADGMKQLAAE